MAFEKRGGQVTIREPNTKHRVEYWVNQEENKVIYTWYNAVGGVARIVEWDYSDRVQEEDTPLNRLRDVIGRNRKVKSFASMGVGDIKERINNTDIASDEKLFDVALRRTYNRYPELPRDGKLGP